MTEKTMTRAKAQLLIRAYCIKQLTADERKAYLELYWDSEYYPDIESFSECEREKFPIALIHDMLSNDAPGDWFSHDIDAALELIYEDYTRGYTNTYLIELLQEIGVECLELIGEPEAMHHCYCCFYCVFKPGDSFGAICPVCFWQDAPGANRITLDQARKNFSEFGAMDQESLRHVSKERLKMYSKYKPESQSLSINVSEREQAYNIVNMWLGMGYNS